MECAVLYCTVPLCRREREEQLLRIAGGGGGGGGERLYGPRDIKKKGY